MLVDVPHWLQRRAISRACVAVVIGAALFQIVELFAEVNEWISMGVLYLSSSAIGLDAVTRGVRKRAGEGPSIRNLAPGGWAIFAGMFWIIAVPAYVVAARRREVEAPEPVRWGSFAAIAFFALFGAWLFAIGVKLTLARAS